MKSPLRGEKARLSSQAVCRVARLSVLVLYDDARQIHADGTFVCLLNNNCRVRHRRRGNCEVSTFLLSFYSASLSGECDVKKHKVASYDSDLTKKWMHTGCDRERDKRK